MFGGTCHALMEDEDEPHDEITGVPSVDGEDKEDGEDSRVTGMNDLLNDEKKNEEDSKPIEGNDKNGAESTGLIRSEHKVRFDEAIETAMGSRSKFPRGIKSVLIELEYCNM